MRTKVTIFVSLLLCARLCYVSAQSISRCEYWIDSDFHKCEVIETLDTAVTMSVALDGYEAGLHFFNFRAVDGNGNVGNLMRTLFYLPEARPTNTGVAYYEAWLDDDYTRRVFSEADKSPSLSLDLDTIRHGLHFFNFRAVDGNGNVGNLMRTLFYLPETPIPDVAGYEYWFDNDTAGRVKADCSDWELSMSVDISNLDDGEHTFNFRAKNSFGQWGQVFTEMFTIEQLTDIDMIETDGKPLDVYTLSGIAVLRQAAKEELRKLPKAVYIINGRKIIVGNNVR